jgi:hypothetical protein
MYSRNLNGFFLNNQDTQWVVLNRYIFKRSKWVSLNNQDTPWVVLNRYVFKGSKWVFLNNKTPMGCPEEI